MGDLNGWVNLALMFRKFQHISGNINGGRHLVLSGGFEWTGQLSINVQETSTSVKLTFLTDSLTDVLSFVRRVCFFI